MNDMEKYKDYVPTGKIDPRDLIEPIDRQFARRAAQPHFLSESSRKSFLKEYAKHLNVSKAARTIGITRSAVYNERRNNFEFFKEMQDVLDEDIDSLEEEQHQAAHERGEDRRFVLKARRPEVWGDKKQVAVTGTLTIGVNVRDLSDRELEDIVLQGKMPVRAEFTQEDAHGKEALAREIPGGGAGGVTEVQGEASEGKDPDLPADQS